MNIIVEITDEHGTSLANEQHSLLNNVTVVLRQVTLKSPTFRAFCNVTVVNMSSISKTLDVTVHRVLGELCNFSVTV